MRRPFESFVVLAGMRTGSNLLEELLASVPGITTHGELFNPHFFGAPNESSRFGQSLADRAADPLVTLNAMRKQSHGLPGFRLFHDHDPRVLTNVLSDPSCAKIVLKRRVIDSYVSLEIARSTGQWWLGDAASARTAKVTFDPDAYADFASAHDDFHRQITRALQSSGQTAFHLTYDDLFDVEVLGGLAEFLGAGTAPDFAKVSARVQNPTPLEDRLHNPEEARAALTDAIADIGDPPMREPGRGPGVRLFRASRSLPLLYMPIRGAADDPIPAWLAALDGGQEPLSGFTQRDLRRWKRAHPGHLSFTVLRAPLNRAHDTFCRNILPMDQDNYADIRHALRQRFDVPLPATWPARSWTLDDHRAAFLGFLRFLKANIGGQTSLRVDNTWASQERLLSAIAGLVVPDRVFRDTELAHELRHLTGEMGLETPPKVGRYTAPFAFPLGEVSTPEIEKAAEAAYRRDYMIFGFAPRNPNGPYAA